MSTARRTASVASLAALTTLAACGLAADPADGRGDVIATHENVAFYPACGDELLSFEGVTWYPIDDQAVPPADADASSSRGADAPGVALAAIHLVVAPGPGDDIGTLTVYEGGYAFWVANSGDLDTWLTTERQTYDWVC